MQVISEGPTKITKATIDAAWRRRIAGRRLIVRDKDCRGLALIVNQPGMTRSYAQSAPGGQSPNRTTLAKQGCHDWKPRHAFPPTMLALRRTGSRERLPRAGTLRLSEKLGRR
jgi:hypothetical protein